MQLSANEVRNAVAFFRVVGFFFGEVPFYRGTGFPTPRISHKYDANIEKTKNQLDLSMKYEFGQAWGIVHFGNLANSLIVDAKHFWLT